MSQKKAIFLTCGVLYYDKWPSVQARFHAAARRLHAQGYTVKSDFGRYDGTYRDDPLERSMLPVTEDLELDDLLYVQHPTTYYTQLLRSFQAAVILCDMDKDVDRLATLRAACKDARIVPEIITYHSDDWTT